MRAESKTSICCLLQALYQELSPQPIMCPDQESNQQPFSEWDDTQSTEPYRARVILNFTDSNSELCHSCSKQPLKSLFGFFSLPTVVFPLGSLYFMLCNLSSWFNQTFEGTSSACFVSFFLGYPSSVSINCQLSPPTSDTLSQ